MDDFPEPEYGDDLRPERPRTVAKFDMAAVIRATVKDLLPAQPDIRGEVQAVLRDLLADPTVKAALKGEPGKDGQSVISGGGGGGVTVSGAPINALAAGSNVTITTSGGTATVATTLSVIGPFAIAFNTPNIATSGVVLGDALPAGTIVLKMWAIITSQYLLSGASDGGDTVQIGAYVGSFDNIQFLTRYTAAAWSAQAPYAGLQLEPTAVVEVPAAAVLTGVGGLYAFISYVNGLTAGAADVYALIRSA